MISSPDRHSVGTPPSEVSGAQEPLGVSRVRGCPNAVDRRANPDGGPGLRAERDADLAARSVRELQDVGPRMASAGTFESTIQHMGAQLNSVLSYVKAEFVPWAMSVRKQIYKESSTRMDAIDDVVGSIVGDVVRRGRGRHGGGNGTRSVEIPKLTFF